MLRLSTISSLRDPNDSDLYLDTAGDLNEGDERVF